LQETIGYHGALNSVAQVLVKRPRAIPDFHHGGELSDLHLVDPDNRALVDFTERARLLMGKRWLLLRSWLQPGRGKRRHLSALFALNRRIRKADLLKENFSQLTMNYLLLKA